MSGGPQVFLGATTFLLRTPPDFQPLRGMWGRAAWCARGRRPAREPSAPRGLRGRAAWCARGRRPTREPSARRASLGASARSPARPCHRPRAPRPGPAGLVMTGYSTTSHVIPLHVFQTLKSHRWNCNVLRESRKLTPGNYVRLLFWLTLWPRRTDDETPLNNDAVRGLVLTVIRRPKAS